jgi:hypothetical protein
MTKPTIEEVYEEIQRKCRAALKEGVGMVYTTQETVEMMLGYEYYPLTAIKANPTVYPAGTEVCYLCSSSKALEAGGYNRHLVKPRDPFGAYDDSFTTVELPAITAPFAGPWPTHTTVPVNIYCGICGRLPMDCRCQPDSLLPDLEETPEMKAEAPPISPWTPKVPQVKTKEERLSKLVDPTVYPAGLEICYICNSSKKPTVKTCSSSVPICRECILEHLDKAQ